MKLGQDILIDTALDEIKSFAKHKLTELQEAYIKAKEEHEQTLRRTIQSWEPTDSGDSPRCNMFRVLLSERCRVSEGESKLMYWVDTDVAPLLELALAAGEPFAKNFYYGGRRIFCPVPHGLGYAAEIHARARANYEDYKDKLRKANEKSGGLLGEVCALFS